MSKKIIKQKKKKSKKGRHFSQLPKITDKDRKFGRIYLWIVVLMGLATAVLVIYSMS